MVVFYQLGGESCTALQLHPDNQKLLYPFAGQRKPIYVVDDYQLTRELGRGARTLRGSTQAYHDGWVCAQTFSHRRGDFPPPGRGVIGEKQGTRELQAEKVVALGGRSAESFGS